MCGEKQSLLKIFGQGNGADCRCHVQKLNMLQGEIALTAERMAGTSEGLDESSHDQVAQKETWNLQDQMSPPASRWETYVEKSTEGLCTGEEEGEGSGYTTDRQQLCGYSKKAFRARRTYSQSNCGRGDQQANGLGRSPAVSHGGDTIAGSLETWNGSTGRPSRIEYDGRLQHSRSPELLPTPDGHVHELLPFEQPYVSSSKRGRFLSRFESYENLCDRPYSESIQNPHKPQETSATAGLLQDKTQQAKKDCMKQKKGDWNGKYLRHLTEGSVLLPHQSFLGTKDPLAMSGISTSSVTDISQDSQHEGKTLSAPGIEKLPPPLGSSQPVRWLSHWASTPLQSVPHAGTAAQGGLFQTDEDFDDDI